MEYKCEHCNKKFQLEKALYIIKITNINVIKNINIRKK